jgi:hypothetical protein
MSKLALHENKALIATQLFHALAECNLASADAFDPASEKWIFHNDIPAECSNQDNAYGHIGEAIKCLGYLIEYNYWVETGDIPEIK